MRDRVADTYGIDADVVPPPVDIDVTAPAWPPAGVEPGFLLCVSRLLAYNNVGAVAKPSPGVPTGAWWSWAPAPSPRSWRPAPANVTLLGSGRRRGAALAVRGLPGLVAASYEDFGLTPLEAAAFGRPAAALRWGGFLDTIVEGVTGVLFDEPEPGAIAAAIDELAATPWSAPALVEHARRYAPDRFLASVAGVVEDVRSGA